MNVNYNIQNDQNDESNSLNDSKIEQRETFHDEKFEKQKENEYLNNNLSKSDSVFSTLTTDIRLKVPSSGLSNSQTKQPTFALDFLEPKKIVKPRIQYSKEKSSYTKEEIEQTADKVLAGKTVKIIDIIFLVEVIEELNSRRINFLMNSEYLKAQKVIEKTNALREQFQVSETSSSYIIHIEQLEQKKKDVEQQLINMKQEGKIKLKQLQELHKNQVLDLKDKQEQQRYQLENDWQSPTKQRQYTKQSPELLQSRAIQTNSVLAGELVYAEQLKKENQRKEKEEIQQKFEEMQNAFDAARSRQETEFNEQIISLQETQSIQIEKAKNEQIDSLNHLNEKLQLIESMINDVKTYSKKQKGNIVNRKTKDLPMIERTSQNIQAKNAFRHQTTSSEPQPLQLPPLIMKSRHLRNSIHSK